MNRETKPRQRRRSRLVPEQARIRISQACTTCRRLKEKCDGNHPCARCLRTTRNCEYSHAEPQHPVSTRAVGKELERVRCLEHLVKHFLGNISLDVENLRSIVDRIGTQPSDDDDDGNSSLEHELNDLSLREESCGVKPISQGIVHYSGEFSHWVFSQDVRRRVGEHLNKQGNEDGSSDLPENTRVMEYWRATQLQSTGSHVLSILDCLPPRIVADRLAHAYLRFAQTNTFFVEPEWLLTKLAILYNQPTYLSSADSPWVCTVVMVLAIGVQFAHMADESLSPFVHIANDDHAPDDSRIFYRMATMLIPDIITIASMESVQASLMLAHYALPLDTHGLAYLYVGLAMKLAIQNGMHRRYTGSDLSESTIEMRNRLWWTTYTLERRISVLHGRPTSIVPSEMDADAPKDIIKDNSSYMFSFENMSTLIHMTMRLSEVSYSIAKLKICPKSLQAVYFKKILESSEKLRSWWRVTLEAKPTQPTTSPGFRAQAHLQLYFYIVEIFIGRPFMFHNTKRPSHQEKVPDTGQTPTASRASGRASLVDGAVTAAFQVITLLKTLSDSTGLARASYVEFSACRAALLMLLAQSLNEQSARLGAAVALGMRLLQSMAAGNILSAKSETSLIEALEQAIRRLHMRETQRSNLDSGLRQENMGNEQNAFVLYDDWSMLWNSLDVEMQQNFPGNDSPISPQYCMPPEFPDQQPFDIRGQQDQYADVFSSSNFDPIALFAFTPEENTFPELL